MARGLHIITAGAETDLGSSYMQRIFSRLVPLALAVFLTACANGYKQFYKPAPGVDPERITALRASPPTGNPIVERGSHSTDPRAVIDAYAKRGYVMIGSSSFNSGRTESDASAIDQGRVVGADLILILDPKYTGSVTTSMPLSTPTSSTSYSTGTATAYGPGGPVTAYGSGTTTTYGTSTTYVPITVHRSDYGAVYFVKQRFGLGAFFRDLNDAERQQLQSNRGAAIRLVADETPAFNADLLVGDIVLSIDGELISNAKAMSDLLGQKRGKTVKLNIYRHGQNLEKLVQLNP